MGEHPVLLRSNITSLSALPKKDPYRGVAAERDRESKVPIIYLGMGQKYEDLKLFEPKDIIDNII
jgi:signal recognition particle GTPase